MTSSLGEHDGGARREQRRLGLAGFPRIDLRLHVVGRFDIAAREVEELAVARMVRFLDALDMRADRGVLLAEEFGEEVLLLRRADDEDGARIGDGLRDILEERLVLLDPFASALVSGMKVANDMIVNDRPVGIVDIEMENARPLVIDPNDGVVMIGHKFLL
jgi:hypothetical protein